MKDTMSCSFNELTLYTHLNVISRLVVPKQYNKTTNAIYIPQ